jgi:HD-GYP domain-containing protein (c-di-GMP phosphodiesterase class II)
MRGSHAVAIFDFDRRSHLKGNDVMIEDEKPKDLFIYVKKLIPAINKISEDSCLFALLNDLQVKDDYTYYHNIGVSIIATMIGKWMHLSAQDLSVLSVSAFLHDIGKLKVPNEILNKAGKLTESEFEIIKNHTIYGYEIINKTIGYSHRHALVALQHHEREDGSGYPIGLKGEKQDILSKIVAVADVFHAMSSKRVYHDAIPYHQVLQKMQQDAFGKLDPIITTLFMEKASRKSPSKLNPLVRNLKLAQVLG